MPSISDGPARWEFPDPREVTGDLVAIGGDLETDTIAQAYAQGLFPMPVRRNTLGWWSPAQRGIIPLEALHVSRSLRTSCRRYCVTLNGDFRSVIAACADTRRPGRWITRGIMAAYSELHLAGIAHSIEVTESGVLVGGLYGVAIGGLFAGESMFHRERDASKVALVALVELLREGGDSSRRILDVQWATPHLETLGAVAIERSAYLDRLRDALTISPIDFTPRKLVIAF
ncbi:MAG: leucyl/phenylalanyl-tRNA--protein transferase [Acidimicrobiia bacterium]